MQRNLVLTGLAVILAAALVLAATLGLAFATEEPPAVPPRGTEGPDIRLTADLHRTTYDGIRLACPAEPKGVNGPEGW